MVGESSAESAPCLKRSSTIIFKQDLPDVGESDVKLDNLMMKCNIVHFVLIIYSGFAMTLQIGFNLKLNIPEITVESLICCESIVYLVMNMIMMYRQGHDSFWKLIVRYYNRGLLLDLAACSPFNIIFGGFAMDLEPWVIIILLRLLRVLSIGRIAFLLEKMEI